MWANSTNKPETQKHSAAFVIDESDKFDNNLCNKLSQLNLNIDIFGKELNLTIGFTDGLVQICDIVQPAQAICDRIVKTAITEAKTLGRKIPYTKGCCCQNPVAISAPEALWLSKEIDFLPNNERKVLQRSIEFARKKLLSAKFSNFTCPFLLEKLCMIYRLRPLVCREHIVISSCCCNTEDNQPLQLPVSIFEAVACLCGELEGNITEARMLPMAIYWAQNSKDSLTKTYHMSELLGRLVDIIHRQAEKNSLVRLAELVAN
jgi:hypothetical protein